MGYIVEYSKSGRASCKACRQVINRNEIRFGNIFASSVRNGFNQHWFHLPCFFQKHGGLSVSEIGRLSELTVEDQKLLEKYFSGEIRPPKPELKSGLDGLENSGVFFVQYAKSNRSRCITCQGLIGKGDIRISQKDYTSERALQIPGGCLDRFHHWKCFAENREKFEFSCGANIIPGFSFLRREDQQRLIRAIPNTIQQ